MNGTRRHLVLWLAIALFGFGLGVVSPPAAAQTADSSIVLYGTPGEYITQGNDVIHRQSTGATVVANVNFDNGVTVDITQGITLWTANFAAPDDVPLAQGDAFRNAMRFPFQDPGRAGVSVTGDGRGCNMIAGEFQVHELTFTPGGDVESFAADFRQSCDGGPEMVGGVRFNSTMGDPDPNFGIGPGCQPPATPGDDTIVCLPGTPAAVDGLAGNDTIFVENGARILDELNGDGQDDGSPNGDDRIVVRRDADMIGQAHVFGDTLGTQDGGDDRIQIAATMEGRVSGDGTATNGGDDVIGILPAGDVGPVSGDATTAGSGRDIITVAGTAETVFGDNTFADGANDVIAITNGAHIRFTDRVGAVLPGNVYGDAADGVGGDDFFIIRGTVDLGVYGDGTLLGGGKDFMRIYPAAVIGGSADDGIVAGDRVAGAGDGGPDTIVAFAGATINGTIYGDIAFEGNGGNDRMSLGATISADVIGDNASGNGGHDSIGIGGAGNIALDLIGDDVAGNGGNDILDVSGRIEGNIWGDFADGNGGADTIYIRQTGWVGGVVFGDGVGGLGGNDLIVINKGAVVGTIVGDGSDGRGGNDVIRVSGLVHDAIWADSATASLGGNDRIVINPAGVVGGIDASKGTNVVHVLGRVDGPIICSPTTTLIVAPGAIITGDTSTC